MGNPPKEKVTTAYTFSQIIFLKEDEEKARFNIGKDIIEIEYLETIQFPKTGKDGFRCKLTFENGDNCNVDLFPSQVKVLYSNLKFLMLEETSEFFKKEIEKLPQA